MTPLLLIEQAVRRGDLVSARQALEKLSHRGGFAKTNAARLANLQWRVGYPARALRTLRACLPGQDPEALERYPEEAAEYAVCLAKLGAVEEAKFLLSLPAVAKTPQAALYRGFVEVETWDYAAAIPHFSKYVKQTKLAPYARLVGYANLACALVYERQHKLALPILQRLLHDSSLGKNTFLLGFVLESAAIQKISVKNYAAAREFLAMAEKKWSRVDGLDKFFLEKWHAFIDLLSSAEDAAVAEVARIRARAEKSGQWETIRDCDRYRALARHEETLFYQLYFGTPYPSFRETLARDFGPVRLPATYPLAWGEGPSLGTLTLLVDEKERERRGLSKQNLVLLSFLLSDRYRPQRLATLFSKMFPDEHYQPHSSPKRLRQNVMRLDRWLKEQKIPLRVKATATGYHLVSPGRLLVVTPLPGEESAPWRPLIVRIKNAWGQNPFSIGEAEKTLALPRRTLLRQLQGLVMSGNLEKAGRGKATTYRAISK